MHKRGWSLVFSFLLLSSLLLQVLPLQVYAQTENNIFMDNFENYQVGSFPSAGGWEMVWSGMGQSYQVISTSYSYSPTRSLQLWGQTGWSAVVQRRFSTDSPIIGYEFSILIDERANQYVDHPAFFCRDCETWGAYYATVMFDHSDGKIKAENGDVLGSWSPRTWYRVKVVLDRQTNKYSVWINGELRGQNIPTSRSDTNRINAIALVSGWPGKKVYYDDVRVFTVVQQQFTVEIVSYNAPSTASPGQTVSVQLTIRYSFPSTSYVGVTISRQLPDGSWDRVWYNPDYQTQRSGQGTLTYTATFTVPNQPDTYRYRITALYWDGSQWVLTDDKYFNIQVQQQQQLSVDVWTNKGGQGRGNLDGGQYVIGESITLYCSINMNVDSLRAKIILPDGREMLDIDRGSVPAGTYSVTHPVEGPTGVWRVICEARSGEQSSSDEVRFTVVPRQPTAILQVGIRHTYIGDLRIWVGVEGGREVLIWNREGGSTQNLFREWDLLQLGFTVNDLPPSESKRWYLKVKDEARGDEGRLEYFRIIYQGQTYESQDRPEIKDYQEAIAWIPSRGMPVPSRPPTINIVDAAISTDGKRLYLEVKIDYDILSPLEKNLMPCYDKAANCFKQAGSCYCNYPGQTSVQCPLECCENPSVRNMGIKNAIAILRPVDADVKIKYVQLLYSSRSIQEKANQGLLKVAISFVISLLKIPFLGTIVTILQSLYEIFSGIPGSEDIHYFDLKMEDAGYSDNMRFIIVLDSQTSKEQWTIQLSEEYKHVFGVLSEDVSREKTIKISRTGMEEY